MSNVSLITHNDRNGLLTRFQLKDLLRIFSGLGGFVSYFMCFIHVIKQ